jgi:hypothetical protein
MPLLVIVTGPSHVGKTSAAEHAISRLRQRAAHVAIDEIMSWLSFGREDQWKVGLPIAYDVARAACRTLLDRDFVVLLESTFTYIPRDDRAPEFHSHELLRFVDVARQAGAACIVLRLRANKQDVLHRNALTERWPQALVEAIWNEHERELAVSAPTYDIDTSESDAQTVAGLVVAAIRSRVATMS